MPCTLDARPPLAKDAEPALDELKNRCELDEPLRIVAALAARFVALKLSRLGEIGMRPLIALAWRNDAALIPSWRAETAPRPNSPLPMDEMPPRTRSFRNPSLMFEKAARPRPSGTKPSWMPLKLPMPTAP